MLTLWQWPHSCHNAKIAKQERLIEFINSRAMKAKQLEEHREKVEEQRVSKLKKPRNGRK